jgi:hypothetical protein
MITDDIYRKPNGLWRISGPKSPFKSALKLARVELVDMSEIFSVCI